MSGRNQPSHFTEEKASVAVQNQRWAQQTVPGVRAKAERLSHLPPSPRGDSGISVDPRLPSRKLSSCALGPKAMFFIAMSQMSGPGSLESGYGEFYGSQDGEKGSSSPMEPHCVWCATQIHCQGMAGCVARLFSYRSKSGEKRWFFLPHPWRFHVGPQTRLTVLVRQHGVMWYCLWAY